MARRSLHAAAAIEVLDPVDPVVGVAVEGLILGLLGAMVAVGMALVYRSNRILNFAQGELGTAPTVLAVCLVVYAGWNYLLAVSVGLVGSLLVGALVELAVIRRFSRSPRLILTVATLGLAQLLSLGAVFIPMIWGKQPTANQIHFPLSFHFTIQPIVFSSDYVVALIVAPLAMLGVAALLRFTSIGVAVRASAERSSRADRACPFCDSAAYIHTRTREARVSRGRSATPCGLSRLRD